MIEPLRKELSARISGLMTFFKDDENLHRKWALARMIAIDKGLNYGNFGTDLYESMLFNREIAQRVDLACENHPEEMEKLLEKVDTFEKKRKKKDL
jgi:hypothetical protein